MLSASSPATRCISLLSLLLLGTMTLPDSPPRKAKAFKSRRKSPFCLFAPWHFRHFTAKIGAMSRVNSTGAGAGGGNFTASAAARLVQQTNKVARWLRRFNTDRNLLSSRLMEFMRMEMRSAGLCSDKSRTFLRLPHVECGFRERLAHERKSLRATEIVIAGVRGAAFPQGNLGGTDEFSLVFFQMLALRRRKASAAPASLPGTPALRNSSPHSPSPSPATLGRRRIKFGATENFDHTSGAREARVIRCH